MMVSLPCCQSPSPLRLMLSSLLSITYYIAIEIITKLRIMTIAVRLLPTAACSPLATHHFAQQFARMRSMIVRPLTLDMASICLKRLSDDDDSGSQLEAWDQLSQDS